MRSDSNTTHLPSRTNHLDTTLLGPININMNMHLTSESAESYLSGIEPGG
jgi:hypothetical protein